MERQTKVVAASAVLFAFAVTANAVAAAPAQTDGAQIASFVKQYPALVGALAGAAAIVLGHLLILRREAAARTLCPKIETAIECELFSPQRGSFPAQLRFVIANKGGATVRLRHLKYRVRGIEKGVALSSRGPALCFPEKLVEGDLASREGFTMFVDSGTTQAFSLVARIPEAQSLILVHVRAVCRFNRSGFGLWLPYTREYTEERVFQLPEEKRADSGARRPKSKPTDR